MSASPNDFVPEAGVRPTRIEFVRESSRGVVPNNPAWETYSDQILTWPDWEPDASKEAVQGAGSPDPEFTDTGSETHEATISYWLQRWLVDGSGNAQDAAADGMLLSADNSWNNTHSYLSRMEVSQNGADGAGYRVYHVGKGGTVQEVTLPFETDEGTPVTPELSYQFEKFRTYRIDQPSSGTTIQVENTGSTDVDVTVEDEGAATSETLTVTAGSTATTVDTYSDIDAVELSTDVDGDVIVSDGSGTTFMTIYGSDSYTTGGDLGVPALGSGSHAPAIGSDYVVFNDDDYSFSTEDIAAEIISGELSVSLEADDNSVLGTSRRNINTTGRRVTWSATVAGAAPSVEQVANYLTNQVFTVEWTADEGTVTGPDAEYFSPGTSDFEASSGKNERSLEIQSSGITIK